MLFSGIQIGLIEIFIFILIGFGIKITTKEYKSIDIFTFYWTLMTILTLIWEVSFILDYRNTNILSTQLIKSNEHVWTNSYNSTYLLPWKLSHIFYAEYGAYADREYMTIRDDWSRVIEGSHAIICGIFSFLAMLFKKNGLDNKYYICLAVAMGSQLMNSILYMINYFNQCRDPESLNFNTTQFPTGKYLEKRPFMYVNIFWTIMPLFIIIDLILFTYNNYMKKTKLSKDLDNTHKNYLK
jgi:hypothetical protein